MTRSLFLFIFILSFITSGCNPYSGLYWLVAPEQDIQVVVPDGYEGPVLIAWEVVDGEAAERRENTIIYRLQSDGSLLLRDAPPGGIGRWFFLYETGNEQTIPIPSSTCFDNAQEQGVVVCTGGYYQIWSGQKLHPNQSYYVIRLKDKARFMGVGSVGVRDLLYKYADRLALPDQ